MIEEEARRARLTVPCAHTRAGCGCGSQIGKAKASLGDLGLYGGRWCAFDAGVLTIPGADRRSPAPHGPHCGIRRGSTNART